MKKININMKEEKRKGQKRQQVNNWVDSDNKGCKLKIQK